MRHENWQAHPRDQIVGDTAQYLFPQPRIAEGAGNDQIGAERMRFSLQPVGDRAMGDILDSNGVYRGAVPIEMIDQLLARRTPVGNR